MVAEAMVLKADFGYLGIAKLKINADKDVILFKLGGCGF